ncbi:MAG: hypothetical protein II791_02600 [Bacteroidales bacterium]|nr:hypothetical protein [Bacteroidales bacterium]
MMKRTCRNYLEEALIAYDAAAREYRLATDEMMACGGQMDEEYEGSRLHRAHNEYEDRVLGLADAIRFTLEHER